MGWLLKLYTWVGGFQLFIFKVFHIGGMFDADEFGSYFQITLGFMKLTATIQIGLTEYE